MTPLRFRLILTMGLFGIGILVGFLLWDHITLPFSNPQSIIGYCANIGFNPQSDVCRFMVFIALPAILLYLVILLVGRKGQRLLFGKKRTAFPTSGSARVEKGKGWGVLLLAGYSVLLALNVPTYHAFGKFDSYHEGEALGASVSYVSGEKIYQDFFVYHGLFQDVLRPVLAFRLFGRSIGAARTLESALKLLAWIFLAMFLCRLFKGRIHWAFGLLTFLALVHVSFLFNLFTSWRAPSVSPEGILSEFQIHRGFFDNVNFFLVKSDDLCSFLFAWALLGVIGAGKDGNPGNSWELRLDSFLYGFVPMAALAYSVDRGVYLATASLLLGPMIYLVHFRTRSSGKDFWFYGCLGGIGGVALLGSLLGWDYADFFRFVFLQMPAYKELSEKIPYPIHSPLFLVVLALYALNLFWLIRDGLQEAYFSFGRSWWGLWLGKRSVEISLLILSVFYFRSALVRSEWQHVIYSVTFLLVLSFWNMAQNIPGTWPGWGKEGGKGRALVWIFCGFTALSCFQRMGRELVWDRNFPFRTPDMNFLSNGQKQTLGFLRTVLKPGDRFFTFSSNACWYYLLDQPCPTRFPYIWIAAPPGFQREVTRDLERNGVKWVFYQEDEWFDQIDGVTNEKKFPVIAGFLKSRYHPFANVGGDEIWVKN